MRLGAERSGGLDKVLPCSAGCGMGTGGSSWPRPATMSGGTGGVEQVDPLPFGVVKMVNIC